MFTSHVDHTAALPTVYVAELLYSTLINLSLAIKDGTREGGGKDELF